jgi:NAD(P)H dehydrogenase (quinone)
MIGPACRTTRIAIVYQLGRPFRRQAATLIQIALFAARYGMQWVSLGLPPPNNSTTGSEEDLNRLGFWLGAAQSNTDVAPPEADLATARHLGQRVAEATLQWAR